MATKYPRKLLRYIKKSFDYLDYIEENGLDYKETGSDEIRLCCPMCGESDYKCYVNNEKKYFCCFKCSFSNKEHDVFNFIAEVENISVRQAIENTIARFREITPEELNFDEDGEIEVVKTEPHYTQANLIPGMPDGSVLISNDEASAPFLKYLTDRGLLEQEVFDSQMRYVPARTCFVYKGEKRVGNIGHRVLWPVYGGTGGLVSWLARATKLLDPKSPKYINCPGSDLAKTVWPFAPPLSKTIVVVEGIIDAMALRRAGYFAYATFGKKLSEEQISLFKDWGADEIVLFLDANAKKEVIKAVESLRLRFDDISVVDVSNWPKERDGSPKDSGSMLAFPDGMSIVQQSLDNRINVKNDLEYYKWQVK